MVGKMLEAYQGGNRNNGAYNNVVTPTPPPARPVSRTSHSSGSTHYSAKSYPKGRLDIPTPTITPTVSVPRAGNPSPPFSAVSGGRVPSRPNPYALPMNYKSLRSPAATPISAPYTPNQFLS